MKRILAALLAITIVGGTTILPTVSAVQYQVSESVSDTSKDLRSKIEILQNVMNSTQYQDNFKDNIGKYYRNKQDTYLDNAIKYYKSSISGWFGTSGVINAIYNRCTDLSDSATETFKDTVVSKYETLFNIYKTLENNTYLYPNDKLVTVNISEDKLKDNCMKTFSQLNTELEKYIEVATVYVDKLDKHGADDSTSGDEDNRDVSSSEVENTAESLKEKQDAANQAFFDDALKLMSEDEKDAFTIASNKYMTQTELDAFKWNLIISQFAVPYIDSLQDTLQQPVFADMASQGLTISSNPYLEAIKLAEDKITGGLNSELFKDGKLVISEKYNMTDIISTLSEENEISYAPLYTDKGESARISDLFNANALYVHDKTTYYGTGVLDNDSLAKTLQNFQEKYADADMNEAIDMIQGYSEIKELKLPVWIQTDGVLLYNMLFVANAIRITGIGTYKNFIEEIGNNQLYVDRWGNICSKLNEGKYVIVYPSYANPLYTSQGTEDDDLVGVGYGLSKNAKENIYNVSDKSIVVPNQVALTQKEALSKVYHYETVTKDKTLKDSSEIFNDAYVGLDKPVWASSVLDVLNTPVNTSVYSRTSSSINGSLGSMPYILMVDNTKNFFINKTILSSYSHDTAYSDDQGAFGCLRDRISSYAETSGMADYKYGSAATFGDSLIFDKYNVHTVGQDLRKYSAFNAGFNRSASQYKSSEANESKAEVVAYPIIVKSGEQNFGFGINDLTLAVDTFTKSNGVANKSNNLLNYDKGSARYVENSSDIGMKNLNKTVMYPFMVNHSYRKGLYTDSTSRIGALSLLNWDFTLKGFSDIHNTENLFMDSKLEVDKYFQVEVLWNAMHLDSDNYKTYAIMNYDASILPDNVSARLMCENIKGSSDAVMKKSSEYEKYCAVPILDSTIDLTDVWDIWNGEREMDNKGTSNRKDNTIKYSNYFSKYEGFMNPTPISIKTKEQNSTISTLRYYLKDQRVSDVLQNYPVEDVTLMAYVWLNYYIPKTSISTKVPVISGEIVSDGSLESETVVESVVTTTATTDVTTVPEPTTDDIQLAGKTIIPEDAIITPYNYITEDSNLLLIFTNENSTDRGDYLYSTESIMSAGEFKSANCTTNATIVQVNIPTLLLAVNKNTNGDNLTYLRNKVDEITVDTGELLSFFMAFQKTPGTALYNIFQGLLQKVHYSVSAGAFGSIYDNSWITEKILEPVYLPIIIALIIGSIGLSIFINCMKTLMRKDTTFIGTIKSIPRMTFFGVLPILVVYSLNWSLNLIATITTKSIASKMSMVKIEEIVKSQESLNLNFETQYQIFREQFETIEDNFEDLSVDFLYGTDANGEDIVKQKTIKELYAEVAYSTILANQNAAALAAETQIDLSAKELNISKSKDDKYVRAFTSSKMGEVYNSYSAGHAPFYYSYEEFVPVNYNKYSESVFYYFYDWIKYQYLRYWATHDSANTEVFSSLARNFSSPDVEFDPIEMRKAFASDSRDRYLNIKISLEPWSEYVSRMYEAEQRLFKKAYGGVNYMYNDARYVYQDTYDSDGNPINEDDINDLFGLSYLFHMTQNFPSILKESRKVYYPTLSSYYCIPESNELITDVSTLNSWAESSRSTFESYYVDYTRYCDMLAINNTPYGTLNPLAYLVEGANWKYYSKSAKLHESQSDLLKDYTFTPDYLVLNDVGGVYTTYNSEEYSDYDTLKRKITLEGSMRQSDKLPYMELPHNTKSNFKENTEVNLGALLFANVALDMSTYDLMSGSLENLKTNYVENDFYSVTDRLNNSRAPFTVYGSKGVLKRSVYNEKTGEFGNTSMTSLEKSLVNLNEKIFKNAQELCNFMPGDMRDSTMIFALALAATFEFNSNFGGGNALPTSLNTSTVTLDDIMRISFAENIDQIVKQRNVIYMMFDSPGGILVGLPVVLAEVILWVALLIRFALLALLLIGAIIVGLGNMLFPKKANKQLLIGLGSQYIAVLLGQLFLLGSTTILFSVFEFNDVWFTNIIKALFLLICYYFVLVMHLKMMTALITNFREFGGTVVAHAIQSAQSRIESVMSASAHVTAGNVNINVNAGPQATNTTTPLGVSRKYIQSNIESMDQPETTQSTLGRRNLTSLETRMNTARTNKLKRTTGRFYNKGRIDISNLNNDQKTVYLCKVAANKVTDNPLEAKKAQKIIYKYMATGKIKDNANEPIVKELANSIRVATTDSTVVDPVKFVANDAKRANEKMTLTL